MLHVFLLISIENSNNLVLVAAYMGNLQQDIRMILLISFMLSDFHFLKKTKYRNLTKVFISARFFNYVIPTKFATKCRQHIVFFCCSNEFFSIGAQCTKRIFHY